MECPDCHKEHSAIAEYCPHCGVTLPTPPAEGVAAEAGTAGLVGEDESSVETGRRFGARGIVSILVAALVVISGVTTLILRMNASKVKKMSITIPQTTTIEESEEEAYNAASQYALTQGKIGLVRDGVNIFGITGDIWLKDTTTGKRYKVSLVRTDSAGNWVAMSMEEV